MYSPQFDYVALEDGHFQVVSATDKNAYADKSITMQRVIALIDNGFCSNPLILDIFRVSAPEQHKYDLAFHYNGHLVAANYDSSIATQSLTPMGTDYGYQHFWKEGEATHTFASTIAMHGIYDLNIEKTSGCDPEITHIETIYESDDYTGVKLTNINNEVLIVITTTHDMGLLVVR